MSSLLRGLQNEPELKSLALHWSVDPGPWPVGHSDGTACRIQATLQVSPAQHRGSAKWTAQNMAVCPLDTFT